jgi:hypothetical protein
LVEIELNQDISMIETKELIHSESESTSRVRRYRDKLKALHCNANVTSCNKSVTAELELDKELEIEKETELQTDLSLEVKSSDTKCLYKFAEASEEQKLFNIEDSLLSFGLTIGQVKNVINNHSLTFIVNVIDNTLTAKDKGQIKTTLPRYFYGVLNNSIKS